MNGDEANEAWELTTFIEAVSAELDRARDLSRVKSEAGRPLMYLVKDLVLNLNVFAEYDGAKVRFRTAAPNETGASELKLELGSATAPVVEQTTKPPPRSDDVRIDDLPLDRRTRENLRNIGVESKRDVERLRDVKVRTSVGEVDFTRLAEMMERVSRSNRRPRIQEVVSFRTPGNGGRLRLIGQNLDSVAADRVLLDGESVEASVAPDYVDVDVPTTAAGLQVSGELVLETNEGERLRLLLEEAER